MTYTYRCRICKILFDGPAEKSACPRCGSPHTERLIRIKSKKIKIKKLTGHFVKIEKKRCKKCIHSEETATSATIKCTLLPAPVTTFHKEKNGWICYSFSPKIKKKEVKNEA